MATWTQTFDECLARLWRDGQSASLIAERLAGIGGTFTRNAVIGRIHRLGLGRHQTKFQHKCGAVAHRKIRTTRAAEAAKSVQHVKAGYAKIVPPKFPVEPLPSPNEYDNARRAGGLVHLIDLERHHCRWAIGYDDRLGHGFCGCITAPGLPYCEHHAQRAVAPASVTKPYIPRAVARVVRYDASAHAASAEFLEPA